MPTIRSDIAGYTLHPVDLAVNKLLAVAGRDEPRDFLDILDLHARTLSIGALCWAGAGKDPGFTPLSLLEMLRRRGRYQPEDFARLHLVEPIDLHVLKTTWLEALSTPTPSCSVVRRTRPGVSTTRRVSQGSWRRGLTAPRTPYPIRGGPAACSRGSSTFKRRLFERFERFERF
jgi:hypothetical protein